MMPTNVILDDEAGRLAALARYDIIDTGVEDEFEQIVQLVQRVFGTPIAAVTLIDSDRQWFKARRGLAVAETPRQSSLCHHTIASADGLAVEDALADPRFAATALVTGDPHIRSYLGAPLRTPDGYQIGALCVISDQTRQFTSADREIIRRFSDIVVSQMELRLIASEDSLTGMMTRRAFNQAAVDAINGERRSGTAAVMAVFDIDHFKQINDRHGHASGDIVLAAVAESLRSAIAEAAPGTAGAAGRLGGEEFGVLLFPSHPEGAIALAQALRAAVAATCVPGLPGVTVSVGLAPLHAGIETVQSWLMAADVALYAAKAQGRNRVVMA